MGHKRSQQEDAFVGVGMRDALDELIAAAFSAEQQLKARVNVIFGKRRAHEAVILQKTARGKKALHGQVARKRAHGKHLIANLVVFHRSSSVCIIIARSEPQSSSHTGYENRAK